MYPNADPTERGSYRTHLTFLRLRVDRLLSVGDRPLSVHRQNISNGFKRTAIDRMFLYILPFLSSTIYTQLDELTLDRLVDRIDRDFLFRYRNCLIIASLNHYQDYDPIICNT
jgi:hypothetical protein